MKKIIIFSVTLFLGLNLGIIGCVQKEDAPLISEDIKGSNGRETVETKVESAFVQVNEIKHKTIDVEDIAVKKVDSVSKQVKTVKEAVKIAGLLETTEEKVNYLMAQANGFYDSKRFKKTIDITQYILNNVDGDSSVAKNLLENAKQNLVAKAKESIGGVTENLTNKIGSFGK